MNLVTKIQSLGALQLVEKPQVFLQAFLNVIYGSSSPCLLKENVKITSINLKTNEKKPFINKRGEGKESRGEREHDPHIYLQKFTE